MTHEQLELLIRTHQAMVYRYLRYMGAAADVAEDVGQETFFAAYKSGSVPMEDAGVEGGRCAPGCAACAQSVAHAFPQGPLPSGFLRSGHA